MKKQLWIVLLIAISFAGTVQAAQFIVCKSQYALCTTASCAPIMGKKALASCQCQVKTGYSVGRKPCQPLKTTAKGQFIRSRYYPIKGYVRCSNDRPWAWCLDKSCMINPRNPSQAACACPVVKNQGDYIIVAKRYSKAACTVGLYSSATVIQANKITRFLKNENKLMPFPIKVYKAN